MIANRIASVQIIVHPDTDPDISWLEPDAGRYADCDPEERARYERQDAERLAALSRGDWGFIGIRAEAVVYVNGVRQHITSGGLWGIEDDSSRDYLRSVGQEQADELARILGSMGFSALTARELCERALTDF